MLVPPFQVARSEVRATRDSQRPAVRSPGGARRLGARTPPYLCPPQGDPPQTTLQSGGSSPSLAFPPYAARSEEHTSELQSLMRISYAVFCLKKKKNQLTSTVLITDTTPTTYTIL